MSIASEIQRIKNNIANAYAKCLNKGATIPAIQNIANLASCINSISTGITPTGTLNITGNGTVDVSNYAQANVNVSGGQSAKYGATIDTFIGNVDSNGILQIPESHKYLIFDGVKGIRESALTYRFAVYNSGSSVNNITGVSFPDLEQIGSYNALEKCFYGQDYLTEVLMPKLVTVPNNNCFREAFSYCTNLKKVIIPLLANLPQGTYGSAFYRAFYCTGLEYLDLSSLTSVAGNSTFNYAFGTNSKLSTVIMPNLTSVTGSSCLSYMFERSAIETFTFEKLSTVTGSSCMSGMFSGCSKLKSLYFPALTPDSFGTVKNQFSSMIYNVNGCTVHFPIKIKKTIQNWSDVISGFGGTNTVILFDLNAATLNFSCSQNDTVIYVDEEIVENNTIDIPAEDTTFIAYNNSLNTVLVNTITNINKNETKNITVNLSQNKQKIILSIGKSGLDVSFQINGITILAIEETTGNYVINYIGNSNNEISYFVNGGNNYSDDEGIITTNGNNITKTISLSNATVKTFNRPNLTSNGTLGGDNFAVESSGYLSYYEPYCVFDNTSNYWWTSTTNSTITFYNPKPLKVNNLKITYYSDSTSYWARNIIVQGSNDNNNWNDLGTFTYVAGQQRTLNVNSNKFYKYYRLTFTIYSIYIRISDIEITGTYKE